MTNLSTAPGSLSRAAHHEQIADYVETGRQRALALGNRGPLTLDPDGRLAPEILEAYHEHGFYVFENVIDADEIAELRSGIEDMIDRAPVRKGADVDAKGRPAFGRDYAIDPYLLIKPLSDPWGGTRLLAGRHQTKMGEPLPEADAPESVVHLMFGMCQASPAALRLYGHPDLLAVAESINGADFVPYNDAIFVKQPGLGGSVSWHQDGATHWDDPEWDEDIHGFNFQVQLYPSTPANGLWVVPGSHKWGKIDIQSMVAENGGDERLPDALPMFCDAGGVTIANRQILHGSFANSSPDPRISITFGFHKRTSVLGVAGMLALKADGRPPVYDEERIRRRSAVIQVAIDARHRHRPDETPFVYEPFVALVDDYRYGPDTVAGILTDYNLHDLSI